MSTHQWAEARFRDVRHFRSACERVRREVEHARAPSDAEGNNLPLGGIWQVRGIGAEFSILFDPQAATRFSDLVNLLEAVRIDGPRPDPADLTDEDSLIRMEASTA